MRYGMLMAALAWALALVPMSSGLSRGTAPEALKDQRAVMYYSGALERPILVDNRERTLRTAAAFVVWKRSIPVAEIAGRVCVGLAFFSNREWDRYVAMGISPSELRPEMAEERYRYYPAQGNEPPLAHEIGADHMRELDAGIEEYLTEHLPRPLDELSGPTCELD